MKTHRIKRKELIYITQLAMQMLRDHRAMNVGNPDGSEVVWTKRIIELKQWCKRRKIRP